MKNSVYIVSIALLLLSVACNTGNAKKNDDTIPSITTDLGSLNMKPATSITFSDTLIDFGSKPMGEVLHFAYKFKNTGSNPLFIKDVRPSCGCTIADYPKQAIAPGGEGEIKAEFNTDHTGAGQVHKTITVLANIAGNNTTILHFKGNVTAAKF